MSRVLSLMVLFTFVSNATAQTKLTKHTLKRDSGHVPAKADLSEFSWLTGSWKGSGLGAKCDEMWGKPAGGCMLGTFRFIEDERLVFSEFFMLTKVEENIVLRLKHFGKDFVGWEVKDKSIDFPLIKTAKQAAYFEGLTYALQEDGSLKAWVAMKQSDGSFKEGEFHFEKTK